MTAEAFGGPFAEPAGQMAQAQTPVAGVALVNGTPNILTWNVPNDGQQHPFYVTGDANVTVLEVGGQVQMTYTPCNGSASTLTLSAGGLGVGVSAFTFQSRIAAPGTVVTVQQSTALTGGAATINAAIVGQ